MVRAAQKGEMENPSPEISKIASTVSKSNVKKMASTKHKGLPEVKESLVSVLHRLKEEGVPARIEGPQKGLGAALCPTCGQFGCTKDHDAEEEVKEGVGRAAIGAVLGSPLGPLGSAAGAAIGASMGKKKKAAKKTEKKVDRPKKYPYGKATKKNPRGKRDQAELDRANAYLKKHPNFGKKNVKEEMVDEGITKELVRAGIKVGGKTGGKVVKTVIKKGGEELKNQAVKVGGELATDAAKKIGQKVKEKGKKVIGPVKEDIIPEAKVDAGKSPETKEKDRNVRKFGVSHNVSGHGKLRRSLHRMNRGDKKIKGDKSAWVEMEGKDYGLTKGDGKPKGVMKAYLDAKAKKLSKEKAAQKPEYRNNPAFGDPSHHSNRKNTTEEVELTETSPNVTYQAKGGRKSGKLGKSSIYSIRGKDESKRDFRKSHVKDIKDGLLKKEEVEMTRKAYNKLHKDFKSDDPKKPRTTKYVPGKGTVSMPVKFVDEERKARKMNVRTKKTIGATIEKNAAAEAKRRANKTGEYKETPKKKRSLKKPSQLTKVIDSPKPAPKPKAKKVTPKKTPITKATVTKPEPKKKSTKKPAAMKKAVERKKEVIKQPEKKTSEKKTFKDFVSQGVKRHKKATQGARVFGKGVVAGAKKAIKFAKDVKKAVSEEVIVESKVKKVAAMIRGLKKPKSSSKSSSSYVGQRDAGAIAAKRMRDKEHNKYVNFLDAPDD